ncbi:DUF554 domain-containing protein [bacterium]|nr:DUF554 domain-containing protein [bacterium]
MELPVGTIVNAVAVIAGSSLGLLLRHGLPPRLREIVFQGIGICTLLIGMQMALKVQNLLVLVFAVLLGGLIGEWARLEDRLKALGERLKERLRSNEGRFSEGLLMAFLIFCVGSMTVVGALEEGTGGNPQLLYVKSVLDGFTSIALAATYGPGVLFSVIPLLVYQIGLTLLAGALSPHLSEVLISQMSAVGGVLILGIGINVLELRSIRVTNFLPALFIVVPLQLWFAPLLERLTSSG